MPTSKRNVRLSLGYLVLAGTVAMSGSLLFLGVRYLALSRRNRVELATVHCRNLAQAISQSISADIRRIDQTLLTVTGELERSLAAGRLDPQRLKPFIQAQERLLPEAAAIRVTDPTGVVIVNNPTGNAATTLADRPWYPELRDRADAGLVVSRPLHGSITGRWVIVFARRYQGADGRFAGVVSIPVYLEYFRDSLGGFDAGPNGGLTLRDSDGGFVTRYPDVVKGRTLEVGDRRISKELQEIIRSGVATQSYLALTLYDNTLRTFAYRRIEGAPLFIVAALAQEDYLATWVADRNRTAAMLAAFLLGTWILAGLLWLAWRELLRHRGHLEELVAERTLELEAARAQADAANAAKGIFLANMSHEIRTPMNAVLGMTHLALQTELSEQQRRYLLNCRSAADSLLGIINDILDYSKIEAGKLEMEHAPFLLEEVLERITRLVGGRAAEKRLDFLLDIAPEVPPSVVGDALRLGQVLTNLCSNALKFTEAGEVVVSLRRLDAGADQATLEFRVRDTGIGMSPEQVQALFQPFTQVDASSTRRFAGTGLGLVISRRLVELMGGRIWVESEPGRGSSFCFTATFGIGDLRPAPRDLRDLPALRVLVVDDSANSRVIMRAMVQALGYRAEVAASAEEGLAELRRTRYDLVFMDWRMPGMDGFEAARIIRQDPELAVKVVLVTAYGDEAVARRAELEGLDGFLTKPVTPSALFDAVLNVFGRKAVPVRPASAATGADRARLRGARVLLVEDNAFNQQVATELLGMMGVCVTLAGDGQEALARVAAERYDAVLMDLQMPVLDGYEATRRMRADPALAGLPILAMTAHAMVQERQRCLALGMDDYITKPIDPDRLAATLAKWLPEPGAPPAVDMQAGLASFSGDQALQRKMLGRFQELFPASAARIRAALDRGDRESAGRDAHSMVSAAGTIGARGLSGEALALQHAIEDGPEEAVAARLERFQAELERVLGELRGFLG